MAAKTVRRFGIEPKVALLSHSSFGASDAPAVRKMCETLALVKVKVRAPDLDAVVERDCVTDVLIAAQQRDNSGGNFGRVFRKDLLRQINTAFTSDQRN
ncbi:phosphate acetyl/butaryl transferase family protein, partial [Candidatus Erwinia dacicola]